MTIKIIKIIQTCSACPSQWDGITDDNRQMYIRYRWGRLSIRIGDKDDMAEFAAVRGNEILGFTHGDNFDGVMTYKELKKLSLGVVEFPEFEEQYNWEKQ